MADSLSEGVKLSREEKNRPLYDECFTPKAIQPQIEPENPELIFTVGLPASGKTTWAKEQTLTDPMMVRVSRDDLRNMRGAYWIPQQENMITEWEVNAAVSAIKNGYSVIVDATNLSEQRRQAFKTKIMKRTNRIFDMFTKVFNVSVEECIERDEKRTDGKVGKKVILQMANKYGLETKYPEYRFQAGLPSAIICDLDGTLAKNDTGRGFYDWSRVGEDSIDSTIKGILDTQNARGVMTIIMSGRDGVCREETKEWLFYNQVPYDILLMRAPKDQRKDSIVKKELFEESVRNNYNILFALDDRNQVVDMWRKELGIKCLQVNYGDF